MAMSKKHFVFVICLILAIAIGVIAFVAFRIYGITKDVEESDQSLKEESSVTIKILSPEKAERMCESVINGTEPSLGAYNHHSMFTAELGVNSISIRVLSSYSTGDTYQKSSYWLIGDSYADREMISMIRVDACKGKVPVIVFAMRPKDGIKISRNAQIWNHYKPDPLLETWEDYDKKLNSYLKHLAPIPSIVILEPDLLMSSFDTHNMQYKWLNDKYNEEFFQRAQKVIKVMTRSWVYVDAGNAAYLKKWENMEHTSKSLLRLEGLRGFAINTGHFFNTSYNNMIARRLHCLTGLHYITDTSRNGGRFSRQSLSGIQKCYFDPPKVLAGLPPGWSWGIKMSPRQKRWSPNFEQPQHQHHSPTHQAPQTHPPTQYHSNNVIQMPNRPPPNQHEDPEKYNQWINEMKNNGAHSHNNGVYSFPQQGSAPQPQPSNYQPSNQMNGQNGNNQGNGQNVFYDLSTPSGRVEVAVTAPPRRPTVRDVELRTTSEALEIFRKKTTQRLACLRREAVTVHDANVWIRTPGEADGRLYEYGTYHKCLLGHSQPCGEECRLIIRGEQRSSKCGCEQSNVIDHDQVQQPQQPEQPINTNGGTFFRSSQSNGIFFGSSIQNQNSANENDSQNPSQNQNQNTNSISSSSSSLADLLRQGKRK